MNTNYFINCVAGNVFKSKTSPSLPSHMYIGLSTSAPNSSGTGVKEPPTSYNYKRIALDSLLTAPENGVVRNEANIVFDKSTGDWGMITHYVIYDAISGGNLLIYDELPVTHTVSSDTVLLIPSQELALAVL